MAPHDDPHVLYHVYHHIVTSAEARVTSHAITSSSLPKHVLHHESPHRPLCGSAARRERVCAVLPVEMAVWLAHPSFAPR